MATNIKLNVEKTAKTPTVIISANQKIRFGLGNIASGINEKLYSEQSGISEFVRLPEKITNTRFNCNCELH